jgi:hypothetical protein
MISGLHWTLWVLIELSAGCALLNLAQWWAVGRVRPVGLMVCACWAVQQAWWMATGSDNLPLTLACDGLILVYLGVQWKGLSRVDMSIFVIILETMACYLPRYLIAESVGLWWLNWSLVALAMVLGLPMFKPQQIAGSVSHGPFRKVEHERA